mgnify:CR=1 FL=1
MTRIVRLSSTRSGPTCTTNWYGLGLSQPLCNWSGAYCIALNWLVAWVVVIALKNVVIVLCWWVRAVVWLLSSSKNNPKHHWYWYSFTLCTESEPWLKIQWYLPLFHSSNIVANIGVLHIPLLDNTIDRFFLPEMCVHIGLPQFTPALSHYAMHAIDVYPDNRVWWWIHLPM